MVQSELFELMARFEQSALSRLEYEEDGKRLVLEKGEKAALIREAALASLSAPVPEKAAAGLELREAQSIRAPLVGTFYAAPAPGKPPFVQPGDRVKKGQTLCILEAMKMINEVPAPRDCIIERVLLQDGELAGFDQPLFEIREL